MAHMHLIEDSHGDVIDAEYYCSDSCHREAVGNEYRGWFGCVELSYSQICENDVCNEILHGVEDDDIQEAQQ